MKYVAFLDILGFKNIMKTLSQENAINYITDFSALVYSVFQKNYDNVKGHIVSDSVILYTNDSKDKSLISLIEIVNEICQMEFSVHGILIRGAIAKGEFDRIPAQGLSNLQKNLIVGQAYIEAYLLENTVKNIGISITREVYQDLENVDFNADITEEKIANEIHYIFRYITSDFLLKKDNLRQFVKLAQKSNWLPHYYNTIYFALKKEDNNKKVEQIFDNIQSLVCEDNPNENWRKLDLYIKNSFAVDVIDEYKTRFLRHIRTRLF